MEQKWNNLLKSQNISMTNLLKSWLLKFRSDCLAATKSSSITCNLTQNKVQKVLHNSSLHSPSRRKKHKRCRSQCKLCHEGTDPTCEHRTKLCCIRIEHEHNYAKATTLTIYLEKSGPWISHREGINQPCIITRGINQPYA